MCIRDRATKARAAGAAARNALKIAVRNGVLVAFGTDENVYTPGENAGEFALMVEWGGMKPMDAIVAATANAAKLMGWDGELGTLQGGKMSDVIAVKGDPLKNIRAMEQVTFVMKGGVVYKESSLSSAHRPAVRKTGTSSPGILIVRPPDER